MTNTFPLLVLAGHSAGDFPFQTDEMAEKKFESRLVRLKHVLAYTSAMIPAALSADWDTRQMILFLILVAGSHFAIDSQRWVEPAEGFESYPIWYDQALHIIALAISVEIVEQD